MVQKRKPPPGNVRRVSYINGNTRGVTTNKCGRLVQFESEQERKLILLLERDPSVADYASQPEQFSFNDDSGQLRRYTPDFQVWRTGGEIELHEVTVAQRRETKTTARGREAAATQICRQRGWTYLVHTEETLPSGFEYANLDALAPFRAGTYANAAIAAWWQDQLHGRDKVHPQIILSRAASGQPQGLLLNTLYHLLWHGWLQMDWNAPFIYRGTFHPDSRIWLSKEAGYLPASLAAPGAEVQR